MVSRGGGFKNKMFSKKCKLFLEKCFVFISGFLWHISLEVCRSVNNSDVNILFIISRCCILKKSCFKKRVLQKEKYFSRRIITVPPTPAYTWSVPKHCRLKNNMKNECHKKEITVFKLTFFASILHRCNCCIVSRVTFII